MKLTEQRVYDLLAAFRSSDPTPGGGSASALAGAVGASLLVMVASLPKARTTSDVEASELREAGGRCSALAAELERLVDADTDAYGAVVAAYKLPKISDAEKQVRSERIQSALRGATDVPLDVMRHCAEALRHAHTVERLGNPNASSDVKVATYLLRAGLAGAAANVEINLGSVKDPDYVQSVREESETLKKATND